MAVTTVAQFAAELNRPAATLLEQLQSAGVAKASSDDVLTEADKERLLDHLRSDEMLLWATDWPHAHFEDDATVPPGLPEALLPKIMVDNPRATYARLREGGSA